jgi:hypothetical protein
MKHFFNCLALVLILPMLAGAQVKHSTMGINLGATTVNAYSGDIQFAFVDESPSQDLISTSFSIESVHRPIVLQPYYSAITEKGTLVNLILSLGFSSDVRTYNSYFGLLKRLHPEKEDKLNVSLGARVGMGRAQVYMGDIYQNDLFIQINRTRTFEDYLEVFYRERQITAAPVISLDKCLASGYYLKITAGYYYPFISNTGEAIFKGDQSLDDPFNEAVSLKKPNILLAFDGSERYKNIFNQRGFFATVGFGFSLI